MFERAKNRPGGPPPAIDSPGRVAQRRRGGTCPCRAKTGERDPKARLGPSGPARGSRGETNKRRPKGHLPQEKNTIGKPGEKNASGLGDFPIRFRRFSHHWNARFPLPGVLSKATFGSPPLVFPLISPLGGRLASPDARAMRGGRERAGGAFGRQRTFGHMSPAAGASEAVSPIKPTL